MNSVEILGYTAGFMIVISYIPQIVKLYRKKNSEDVSVYTYISFLIAQILFLIYGFIKVDLPIIMVNIFSSVLCIINIMLIYIYRHV